MTILRAWNSRRWAAGLAAATLAASACSGITTQGGGATGSGATGSGAYYGDGGRAVIGGPGGASVAVATATASTGIGGSVASSTGSGGSCGEGGLTVLAAGLTTPGAIAVDATDVYWVNQATSNPDGSVMKCAVGGCNGQPTTLAAGQNQPVTIALDDTNVYWGNTGSNGYGTDGAVMRCAKTGCAPTAIAGGIAPSGLAVAGGSAYWLTTGNGTGTLFGCTLPGCTPQQLAALDGVPFGLTSNGTALAFYTGPSSIGVVSCSIGACSPSYVEMGNASAVALDSTSVYWLDGGSVLKCPISGCNAAPTVIASGLNSDDGAIATDGVNVYFTVNLMGSTGSVMKCPVTGCNGAPTMIACGPSVISPLSIAVDQTSVYWSDLNAGTVTKAPK